MADDDLGAIERCALASDQAGLAAASARLGCDLTLTGVRKLIAQHGNMAASQIFQTLDDALAGDGIAFREVRAVRNKTVCLVVRTDKRVTVGVTSTLSKTPIGTVWPELKPWFKELARNRERAEA